MYQREFQRIGENSERGFNDTTVSYSLAILS